MVAVDSEQPSEKRLNLVANLQPIVYSMRIFGIDLTPESPHWKLRRWGFVLLGVFNVVFITLSTLLKNRVSMTWLKLTSTMSWSDVLVEHAVVARNILLSLGMLEMISLSKWKPLCEKMRQLEKFTSCPAALHTNLLRVSTASIASVLLLVNEILLKLN